MVNRWLFSILSRFLPACCPFCDTALEPRRRLCAICQAALPKIIHPCIQCGLPLPTDSPTLQRCGHCLTSPPAFDRLLAAHRYDAPLSALIGGYKFHRQLHHARLFADLIREVTQREHPLPEILLPVPLHPQRQRYRGYNQALEITRMVGKQLAIPIDHLSLRRHRATAAQSDLDAAARPGNVRGAFSLKKNLDYQHLAIVDDVVTTGNTANEIAKLLKRAGARRVDVWCVARVIC